MAKDKQPNSTDPAPSDVERRVDEMLDINVTDKPTPKTVKVVHADDDSTPEASAIPAAPAPEPATVEAPEIMSAPPLKKSRPKKGKTIAVAVHDDTPDATVAPVTDQPEATELVNETIESEQTTAPELPQELQPTETVSADAQSDAVIEAAPPTEELVDESKATSPTDSAVEDAQLAQDSSDEEIPLEDTLNEPATNKAVDEIIAEEADELLAVQDEVAEAEEAESKPSFGSRLRHFLLGSKFRWTLFALLVVGGVGVGAWPASRYAVLNAAGVRAEASLQVIDQSTLQPLKNVDVKIAGATKQTDAEGRVNFEDLRLGMTEFSVTKKAFAPLTGAVTIGWGSNPLGERKLQPVGIQYAFVVNDYISGKAVDTAAASAGQADAAADPGGKIRLTLEHSDAQTAEVTVSAPGYRSEKVQLDLASKLEISVKMVPDKQAVFVSKRSGKYDVYKVDIDGKNETVLLAATGSEREDISLSLHPTSEVAAVVSTRDNKRNTDGYLMSTLTLVNVVDGSSRTVTQSEQVSLIGWSGNSLIYVQIAAGTSAANPNRQRLMSYDYKQNNNKQLASTNYFNDVVVVAGQIYYAPSSTYQSSNVQSHLFRINPDGSNKQTVLGVETWNIVRSDYETLLFSVPNEWYDFKIGNVAARKLNGQPNTLTSRVYADSPDKKRSLWVDQRDGKGVLLVYDTNTKKETIVLSESGLRYPVHWLNDKVIIYRINSGSETADYAVSLDGGKPVKIKDVTSTGGVDKWYYY